ncbi:hypothetical protein R6G85_07140 [Actinotignum urinale]|uniref:hypothetical protein n=1 Tax=Actinotignum urinale TaxID=190146 RepID=UPI002A822FA8|nr:hypothetical protein [Actinotignum urinale]MDY5152245.1 hypothetical protein [Actinotignum urinale]
MTWYWYVLIVVIVGLLVFWKGVSVARRLDRLNTTLLKSRRVLEHALQARARYAMEFAHTPDIDVASALILTDSAQQAMDASMFPIVDDGLDEIRGSRQEFLKGSYGQSNTVRERIKAEEFLTHTLRYAVDDMATDNLSRAGARIYPQLEQARINVRMARTFYNSHVFQAQRLWKKPLVRIFRLAGHTSTPQRIDFDDE